MKSCTEAFLHASIIFSSVASSFAIVDLPLPLLPEIPIMLPFRTGIDTSEIIVSSPYENVTFSVAAQLNSTSSQPVISLVTGVHQEYPTLCFLLQMCSAMYFQDYQVQQSVRKNSSLQLQILIIYQ
jgi:hypothetical protein